MSRYAYGVWVLAVVGLAVAYAWHVRPDLGPAPAPMSNMMQVKVYSHIDAALERAPLPPEQEAAVRALAQYDGSTEDIPQKGEMEAHGGPRPEVPLPPAEQEILEQELTAARNAVARFDTLDEAKALGYLQSSSEVPAIGSHWVNWTLVNKPFDPAAPSMFLFATIGGVPKLVGYSYFVQSDTEPEGFAGPNDMWHRHGGICLINGWRVTENEPKEDCKGYWINGSKHWMSHLWVVPGFENPYGRFAVENPEVCPDARGCRGSQQKGAVSATEHSHH